MPFQSLRRWAQAKVPLRAPEVASVEISSLLIGFGSPSEIGNVEVPMLQAAPLGQIALPLLEVCSAGPDLALWQSAETTPDLGLGSAPQELAPFLFEALLFPDLHDIPLQVLRYGAGVLDLLVALKHARTAGKAYGTNHGQALGSREHQSPDRQPMLQPRPFERCRHGLLAYSCNICSVEAHRDARPVRLRKQSVKVRTIDVFDLLLPYLQPPLETLLNDPVLFPPGRRPYPFQITGIRFLSERKGALLGDEMGLGKTIQAIVAMQILFRHGAIRSVLVLCPRSLLGVWEKEFKKWAPELNMLKVRGPAELRAILWETKASVHLTTYETLREDSKKVAEIKHQFDLVVLDEAQRIKNPETGLSRAVRQLRPRYRWALTATPLENKLEDVTSIFDFLVPGLFSPADQLVIQRLEAGYSRSEQEIRDQYKSLMDTLNLDARFGPNILAGLSAGLSAAGSPQTPEFVKGKISDYFLRRRTKDVRPDLPEKISNEVWLDLTDEQRATYDSREYEGRARLQQPDATRVHVFSLISELKQICNLDPGTSSSSKVDYLLDQLDAVVENQQKALVFSQFPKVTLAKVVPTLSRFDPAIFDGSLSDVQRDRLISDFQEGDLPRVLLMSVQSGGLGITLTRANHVFHFDHWWNPAVARQAEGRAHRIGQSQPVFVYDIFTNDTIEERIHALLVQKQNLFDTVIDDLSADYVQGKISDDELFGLFDLKPPQRAVSVASAHPAEVPGKLLDDWQSISPEAFEKLTARLYERMGYLVQITPHSRDGGIDIIARRPTVTGEDRVIIQCKHSPAGTVGEPVVRELMGVWQEHREASHAVLVTSGHFSQNAVDLAGKHRIDLVDGIYMKGLLLKYGVSGERPS
jgi:superfamily II DNA or RNA helicase